MSQILNVYGVDCNAVLIHHFQASAISQHDDVVAIHNPKVDVFTHLRAGNVS